MTTPDDQSQTDGTDPDAGNSDPSADDTSTDDGTSTDAADDTSTDDSGTSDEPDEPQAKGGKQQQQPPDPAANLKKALAAERTARKTAEKDLANLRRQHASAEERAILEAKETAAAEREALVKPPLLKALAAAELRAAGVPPTGAQRLVGLLDLDKVDIDDDGELVGLDDQVSGLKEEFPNLFEEPQPNGRQRAPRVNAGAGGRRQDKGGNTEPVPWYEQLAAQVLNPGGQPGVARR